MTVKMAYRNYFFFFTGVSWYRLRRGQHERSSGSRHIQMFLVFTSHRFDVRYGKHQNLYAVRGMYFPLELRPYSGSWPSLTGLGNHSIWTHHTRWDSSGRRIGPSQRPLPDKTQHSQHTNTHAHDGIRTHNPSKREAADPNLRPRGQRTLLRETHGGHVVGASKTNWKNV